MGGLQLCCKLAGGAAGGGIHSGPVPELLRCPPCPVRHHKRPRRPHGRSGCPRRSLRHRGASHVEQRPAFSLWQRRIKSAPGPHPLWTGHGRRLCVRIWYGLGRSSDDGEEQSQHQSLGFAPPRALRTKTSAPQSRGGGAASAGAVGKLAAAYPLRVTAEEVVAMVVMAAAVNLP